MTLHGIASCSTATRARAWLGARGVAESDSARALITRLRFGGRALVQGLLLAAGTAFAQGPASSSAGPTAAASAPQAVFGVLVGRWVRPDGGYVIAIKAVDATGKLDASYANPSPLPFYTAEVARDGGTFKLYFELRAAGYNGSTYTLSYDAASDQLRGVYYQAVQRQKYEVAFARAK
jgi:uncharacterized protein (DUF2147 family)